MIVKRLLSFQVLEVFFVSFRAYLQSINHVVCRISDAF